MKKDSSIKTTFKLTLEQAIRINTHFVNLGGGSLELRRNIEIYYRIAARYGYLEGDDMDDDLDEFFRRLDTKKLVMKIPLYQPHFRLPFGKIQPAADVMPMARPLLHEIMKLSAFYPA